MNSYIWVAFIPLLRWEGRFFLEPRKSVENDVFCTSLFAPPKQFEQPDGFSETDAMQEQSSKRPIPLDRDLDIMTEHEAADYLRIKTRQLYNWRMAGLIPFMRIGRAIRFCKSTIDNALARMTRGQ